MTPVIDPEDISALFSNLRFADLLKSKEEYTRERILQYKQDFSELPFYHRAIKILRANISCYSEEDLDQEKCVYLSDLKLEFMLGLLISLPVLALVGFGLYRCIKTISRQYEDHSQAIGLMLFDQFHMHTRSPSNGQQQ